MATVAPHQQQRSDQRLRAQLADVAKRARLIGTVDSMFWILASLGVGFLLIAWLDIIWQLPTAIRQAVLPVAFLACLLSFAWLLYRVWCQTKSNLIARRMDEVGQTGGQILSGLELATDSQQVQSDSPEPATAPLARGIASVAVDQATARAAAVPKTMAAPWSQSRRSGVTFVAVATVTALFALIAPRALGTSWKRLSAPSVDTPPYSPLAFDVSPGHTSLTYGQALEVTAVITGGAVEKASLVLGAPKDPDAPRVAMFPRGGGKWQAVVPRVHDSLQYCVVAERGRSAVFDVEVLQTPKIELASYTISAPQYTGLPPREGRYPQDPIAGLFGTEVAFVIQADRPLSGGTVTLEPAKGDNAPPEVIELHATDDRQAVGNVTLKRPGTWSVSVTGANGVDCDSPIRMEVELLVDQPPIARIAQPRPMSYATPTTRVPVAAIGEDDFGIARMRLYRMIDGSRPIPLEIPIDQPRRTMQGGFSLPLESYGLEPGDRISLLARVDDTRPDASQGGESPLAEIEIISQRDFDRIIAARQGKQMLENKFRQARRMMDKLASESAELQEQLANSDKNDAIEQQQIQKKIDQLRHRMQEVANAMDDLADQELPLEVDEQWNELLREQADALREAAKNAHDMKKNGDTNQEQADDMKEAIDRLRQKQDEQIGQPMEALKKIAPLIAAESKFVQLVARQKSVVDALDRYRQDENVRDEADRQQIVKLREEEAAIRRALEDLMQEIETAAEGLGDDPEYQELKQSSFDFVGQVRDSVIDEELSKARQSLGGFDGAKGYGNALTALEEMEKFLGQCNANGQKAGTCLKNKFAPGLPGQNPGNSLQQMLNQMGLNSGQQSGYSMRGNSGQNVGLYGNQPFAQPQGRGRGDQNRMMPARGNSGSATGSTIGMEEMLTELPETSRTNARDVPLRYRRQTERYLRRLAEQMDQ